MYDYCTLLDFEGVTLRLITADAMGMAKERDRTGVDVDGSGSEVGDKHGETPRCTQGRGSL